MFVGKRVRVRALEDRDIGIYLSLINNPEIRLYAFSDSGAPVSPKMAEQLFAEWTTGVDEHKANYWFTAEKIEDGVPLGLAALFQIDFLNGRALGPLVMLLPEFQGAGYAAEIMALLIDFAFARLRLHRLYSEVAEFNQKQARLRERMGYQREGVQREAVYRLGRHYHVMLYGLLSDEWWPIRQRYAPTVDQESLLNRLPYPGQKLPGDPQ